MADKMNNGFIRNSLRQLVVVAAGAGLIERMEQGFMRDEKHRVIVVGPEGEPLAGAGWANGDNVSVYTENPEGQLANVKGGKEASPVETYGPTLKVSRTMSMPESLYPSGDGAVGAAAIYGVAKNLSTSQTQAVGVYGAAKTSSSYEGAHSLADAAGGYFVGRSVEGSRVGMGAFISGRRDTASGRTTGAEIVSDNATATPEEYAGTLPGTKGIHLHPVGASNSAAGLVVGHPSTASWDVGIGAVASSCVTAFIRDDSKAKWGVLFRSEHEKAALAVAKGAGQVVVGLETPQSTTPLLEVYSETTLDPIVNFGTDKGVGVRAQIIRNSTGNVGAFASAATNSFLTGTVAGDSGLTFAAGKTLHLGAATKESKLRVSETGVGFNGAAPVAKASAISSPAAELAPLKTAVDAIRVALTNVGITA